MPSAGSILELDGSSERVRQEAGTTRLARPGPLECFGGLGVAAPGTSSLSGLYKFLRDFRIGFVGGGRKMPGTTIVGPLTRRRGVGCLVGSATCMRARVVVGG